MQSSDYPWISRPPTCLRHRCASWMPTTAIEANGTQLLGGTPCSRFADSAIAHPEFFRRGARGRPAASDDRCRGLDERRWDCADWHYWLTFCARHSLAYSTMSFVSSRVHADSQASHRSRVHFAFHCQLLAAAEPHAQRFLVAHPEQRELDRIARFSIAANSAFAALAGGSVRELMPPPFHFHSLGLRGWHRYLWDSRIVERVGARLARRWFSPRRRQRGGIRVG